MMEKLSHYFQEIKKNESKTEERHKKRLVSGFDQTSKRIFLLYTFK